MINLCKTIELSKYFQRVDIKCRFLITHTYDILVVAIISLPKCISNQHVVHCMHIHTQFLLNKRNTSSSNWRMNAWYMEILNAFVPGPDPTLLKQ